MSIRNAGWKGHEYMAEASSGYEVFFLCLPSKRIPPKNIKCSFVLFFLLPQTKSNKKFFSDLQNGGVVASRTKSREPCATSANISWWNWSIVPVVVMTCVSFTLSRHSLLFAGTSLWGLIFGAKAQLWQPSLYRHFWTAYKIARVAGRRFEKGVFPHFLFIYLLRPLVPFPPQT